MNFKLLLVINNFLTSFHRQFSGMNYTSENQACERRQDNLFCVFGI